MAKGRKMSMPGNTNNMMKQMQKMQRDMEKMQEDIEAKEFETLQKNKKPLDDDERAAGMKSKAVWHHGPNGEETPAVWKSVNKKGKCTYVTHTHRAFNKADSLKGCIKKYHDFIKGTA